MKKINIIIALLTQFGEGVQKSGRAGGVVIQKNGIQRQFTAPALRNTQATGVVRGMFSFFNTQFTGLSQDIQKAWGDYNFTYVDRLSRSKSLSGKSAFTRINMNLDLTNQGLIATAPPLPVGAPPILGLELTADNSAHTLNVTYDDPVTGVTLIFATAPQNPSIFKPNQGKFKLIIAFNLTGAATVDLTDPYDATFGINAVSGVGKKIFMQFVNVSSTGATSTKGAVVSQIVA